MPENGPTLDELLSHKPLGRILQIHEIATEFALIRDAFKAAGKPVPSVGDFRSVAVASGTHLLKLVSARAPIGQCVLRFAGNKSNGQPEFFPSLDARKSPIAKLVFRPWEIAGHRTRTLADNILTSDEVSPVLLKGFADAFGADALEVLQEGLLNPLPPVVSLPAAEFPIIFLPRPGGGDIQATPLAPAEAYVRFDEVVAPYFQKTDEKHPFPPRGDWHHQYVADKPQNISSAAGKRRTRFLATMPRVMAQWSAELFRFARGGRFPRWRDPHVEKAIAAYAALLDRVEDYSNQSIRKGLDDHACRLIEGARTFIDATMEEIREEFEGEALPRPPSIRGAILSRRWASANDQARARRVLLGEHFQERLDAAGEL